MRVDQALAVPPNRFGFYRDIAVLAYPLGMEQDRRAGRSGRWM